MLLFFPGAQIIPQDQIDAGGQRPVVLFSDHAEFFYDLPIQGQTNIYFLGFHRITQVKITYSHRIY